MRAHINMDRTKKLLSSYHKRVVNHSETKFVSNGYRAEHIRNTDRNGGV